MMDTPEALGSVATGRAGSLFEADLGARLSELRGRLGGARVLVIGGAGSVGSATVKELARFPLRCLHVVDISENNLVELVRDLRGSRAGFLLSGFRTLPIDYGSPVFRRFLRGQERYDFVLNFAALKHVRSEKDVCSLLQMIDTNLVKQARLLRWLAAEGGVERYFSVSTDKAANPVNLMGATKRMAEHVMFSSATRPVAVRTITTARFANVAFSDGSLLSGWVQRVRRRQPVAVPEGTRRYFVSLLEAGQICLIAAALGRDETIVIPKLEPEHDARDLVAVARAFLRVEGFEPRLYTDERQALGRVEADMAESAYPVLVTPLDTDGEKPCEEFVGKGEVAEEIGMKRLCAIRYVPAAPEAVQRFLAFAESIITGAQIPATKSAIVAALREAVPELRHRETGRSLDDRL